MPPSSPHNRRPATAFRTRVVGAITMLGVSTILLAATQASARNHARGHAVLPSLARASALVRAQLSGIRQHGLLLGRPSAPVRLIEYGDLISPACAASADGVLPRIISRYVRSGVAAIQFEPIVDGPLSDQFALGAYAAGTQRHAWDYILLDYLSAGASGTPATVSPADLAGALGLDVAHWQQNARRPRWAGLIQQSETIATVGGFPSFPVFLVSPRPAALLTIPQTPPKPQILTPPVSFATLARAIGAAARTARLT